ncbi:MAG: THUMP domain-containing protein [Candidatus Hadarchaeota archaeon]
MKAFTRPMGHGIMSNEKVLVRYGELALKSQPVRKEFEENLLFNIRGILGHSRVSIETERGRIFVSTENPGIAAKKISKLPGVVSTSHVWEVESGIKEILEAAEQLAFERFPSEGSFAVRARRVGSHEFTSKDIEEAVGELILKEIPEMEVNLDSPESVLNVEVRGNSAYLFTDKVVGTGGLPVGSQNSFVIPFHGSHRDLFSSYSLMKRGPLPELVNVEGKSNRGPLLDVARKLLEFHPKLRIYSPPCLDILSFIEKEAPNDLIWYLREVVKFRISEDVANVVSARAIATSWDLDLISSIGLVKVGVIENFLNLPLLYPLSRYRSDELRRSFGVTMNAEMSLENIDTGPRLIQESSETIGGRIKNFLDDFSINERIKSSVEDAEVDELEV